MEMTQCRSIRYLMEVTQCRSIRYLTEVTQCRSIKYLTEVTQCRSIRYLMEVMYSKKVMDYEVQKRREAKKKRKIRFSNPEVALLTKVDDSFRNTAGERMLYNALMLSRSIRYVMEVTQCRSIRYLMEVTQCRSIRYLMEVTQCRSIRYLMEVMYSKKVMDYEVQKGREAKKKRKIRFSNPEVALLTKVDDSFRNTAGERMLYNALMLSRSIRYLMEVTQCRSIRYLMEVNQCRSIRYLMEVTHCRSIRYLMEVTQCRSIRYLMEVNQCRSIRYLMEVTQCRSIRYLTEVTQCRSIKYLTEVTQCRSIRYLMEVMYSKKVMDYEVQKGREAKKKRKIRFSNPEVALLTKVDDSFRNTAGERMLYNALMLSRSIRYLMEVTQCTSIRYLMEVTQCRSIRYLMEVTQCRSIRYLLEVTQCRSIRYLMEVMYSKKVMDYEVQKGREAKKKRKIRFSNPEVALLTKVDDSFRNTAGERMLYNALMLSRSIRYLMEVTQCRSIRYLMEVTQCRSIRYLMEVTQCRSIRYLMEVMYSKKVMDYEVQKGREAKKKRKIRFSNPEVALLTKVDDSFRNTAGERMLYSALMLSRSIRYLMEVTQCRSIRYLMEVTQCRSIRYLMEVTQCRSIRYLMEVMYSKKVMDYEVQKGREAKKKRKIRFSNPEVALLTKVDDSFRNTAGERMLYNALMLSRSIRYLMEVTQCRSIRYLMEVNQCRSIRYLMEVTQCRSIRYLMEGTQCRSIRYLMEVTQCRSIRYLMEVMYSKKVMDYEVQKGREAKKKRKIRFSNPEVALLTKVDDQFRNTAGERMLYNALMLSRSIRYLMEVTQCRSIRYLMEVTQCRSIRYLMEVMYSKKVMDYEVQKGRESKKKRKIRFSNPEVALLTKVDDSFRNTAGERMLYNALMLSRSIRYLMEVTQCRSIRYLMEVNQCRSIRYLMEVTQCRSIRYLMEGTQCRSIRYLMEVTQCRSIRYLMEVMYSKKVMDYEVQKGREAKKKRKIRFSNPEVALLTKVDDSFRNTAGERMLYNALMLSRSIRYFMEVTQCRSIRYLMEVTQCRSIRYLMEVMYSKKVMDYEVQKGREAKKKRKIRFSNPEVALLTKVDDSFRNTAGERMLYNALMLSRSIRYLMEVTQCRSIRYLMEVDRCRSIRYLMEVTQCRSIRYLMEGTQCRSIRYLMEVTQCRSIRYLMEVMYSKKVMDYEVQKGREAKKKRKIRFSNPEVALLTKVDDSFRNTAGERMLYNALMLSRSIRYLMEMTQCR